MSHPDDRSGDMPSPRFLDKRELARNILRAVNGTYWGEAEVDQVLAVLATDVSATGRRSEIGETFLGENDYREALLEQQEYLRRLKHRADVRGGPDVSAMGIADEAIARIEELLDGRKPPSHEQPREPQYAELERQMSALSATGAWRPIATAPKTGPAETILLYVPQLNGTGGPVLAHWAYGGGEDQPRFGPAWFYSSGYGFQELPRGHIPTHWMELPRCPADWRGATDGTTKGKTE